MQSKPARIERVLCALDVGSAARGPLAVAGLLAQTYRASIDALYAPAPLATFDTRAERVRRLIAEHNAREQLEAMLVPFATSLQIQRFITRGRASDVILSHSELHQSDLIVMGSPQRAARAIDSVTIPVRSEASCAVLTVPSHTPECAMRRLLLPVATFLAYRPALAWAISLARRFGAVVELVELSAPSPGFWRVLGRGAPVEPRLAELSSLMLSALHEAGVKATLGEGALNASALADLARDAFDLVILGLHSGQREREGARCLLRALRNEANLPVLSVRASAQCALLAPRRRLLDEHLGGASELGLSA